MLGDLGWRVRNGPENHTVGGGEFESRRFRTSRSKSRKPGRSKSNQAGARIAGDQAGMILEVRARLGFV